MKQMPHRFRRRSGSPVLAPALAIILALVPVGAPYAAMRAAQTANATAGRNNGWSASITGTPATPPRVVAVAKERQRLFLFEKHSPLRLAAQFACTTGKAEGDKRVQGDLKTPEGVYFVEKRLDSGLNYEKYGNVAYTLNYPNPVDKLRRKTGYGIWIHGRGTPITPYLTEGCVSLNNDDIAVLGKNLAPGTPVALAQDVRFTPEPSPGDKAQIAALTKRTFNWAKAWSGRSKKLFDFYDPEAYSLAQGQPFPAFRGQKERLFRTLPWIDTRVRNVQALQGPGYWVTWFQQDYRAPNLVTRGVRRLYWQKDAKGEFRIVGMEWHPRLNGTLTAGLDDASAFALAQAANAGTPQTTPARPSVDDGRTSGASTASPTAAVRPSAGTATKAAPSAAQAAQATQATQATQDGPASPVAQATRGQRVPERLPQTVQPLADAPANTSTPADAQRGPHTGRDSAMAVADASRAASTASGSSASGTSSAPSAPSGPSAPSAPSAPSGASSVITEPSSRPAARQESVRDSVLPFIEAWRTAWQSGNLDAYMRCYDNRAVQGRRKGASAIRSHKRRLWANSAPRQVLLTNVTIVSKHNTVTARMNQSYTDSRSFADTGVKTLHLQRKNNVWRILREDWSAQ